MSRDITQMEDVLGLLRLGYAQPLLELPVRRWQDGETTERVEAVVEEVPVAMVYNGLPHAVMMATPQDLEDFALGFSITEELIGGKADLQRTECIRYSRGIEIQMTVSAACE
jgi:FdhD protein